METTLVCSHCSISFKTLRGLRVHEGKKHKPKSPIPVATEIPPTDVSTINTASSLEKILSLFLVKNVEQMEAQKKEREEERRRRELEREEERRRRELEREEERRLRELERKEQRRLREEEMERERCRREEEMERERLAFEQKRQMLMEIEDRKDQRWKDYVSMQNRALDEWAETRKQEQEARKQFLEQRQQWMLDWNQKNRRLSIGDACLHQKDEMVIYGTSSRPLVASAQLKHFLKHVVFDSPPPEVGEIIMDMCGLVDSMSTMEVCEFMGIKFDEHHPTTLEQPVVEILAWENVVQEMEKVMDIPKEMVSTYIGHVSKNMPYSQPEKNWWSRRSPMKTGFARPPGPPKEGYKRDYTCLPEQKENKNPPDVLDLVDTDPETYTLVPSTCVSAEDVVGSGDESVSSTMRHVQLRQRLLEKWRHCLANEMNDLRRRHWLQIRWSIMTGRIFLVLERIFQYGVYIPDSMMRYMQDTKFKAENTHIEPASRSLFKRRFLGEQNLVKCQMCFCVLPGDGFDWERAHVVPSKKSKLGSNGEHNLILCCSSCNTKTGDMDPLLHPEYHFHKSRGEMYKKRKWTPS